MFPLIFSPDEQFHPTEDAAVSASEDGTARVWDLGSGTCVKTLQAHNKKFEVLRACWAPPGRTDDSVAIATGSADGTVRLWGVRGSDDSGGGSDGGGGGDKETGVERFQALEVVGQLRHRNKAKGLDGQVYSCQFITDCADTNDAPSPTSGTLRLLTASDSTVHLWDVETRKRVAFRALSKVGDHSIGGERNPDDIPFIFDAKPRPGSGSSTLAVALSDGTVRVGDILARGGQTEVLRGSSNTHLTSLAWSEDGAVLASCGGNGTVTVWDTKTWTVLSELSGHSRPVYGAAFYPGDGEGSDKAKPKLLLSWSSDETVCAWDAGSARGLGTAPLVSLSTEEGFPIYSCSVSPDGKRLAVAGGGGGGKAAGFMGVPIKVVLLGEDDTTETDIKAEGGGSADALP